MATMRFLITSTQIRSSRNFIVPSQLPASSIDCCHLTYFSSLQTKTGRLRRRNQLHLHPTSFYLLCRHVQDFLHHLIRHKSNYGPQQEDMNNKMIIHKSKHNQNGIGSNVIDNISKTRAATTYLPKAETSSYHVKRGQINVAKNKASTTGSTWRRLKTTESNNIKRNIRDRNGNNKKNNKYNMKRQNMRNTSIERNDKERVLPPHKGSYANPLMAEKYEVLLPTVDTKDRGNNDQELATNKLSLSPSSEAILRFDWTKTSKRKVALLVGYLGKAYAGLQMNINQRTIQAEIELALFKARLLKPLNFGHPNKYGWSSSARTDKGVHACAQVVSFKIELPFVTKQANTSNSSTDIANEGKSNEILKDMEIVRHLIEQQLPPDIRILDVLRTTRSFCAKTQRDRVRYQYMIPSLLLHPDYRSLFLQESISLEKPIESVREPLTREEVKRLQRIQFRSTKEQRQLLQKALNKYKGTHSFHKFTNKLKFGEASAKRYILEFEVQDPIVTSEGVEWIPTYVVGQSFLYHQIRKMVSMAIDVARGVAPISTIDKALTSDDDNFCINLAPAQGLFLELTFFENYNRRKQQNKDLPDLDWHMPYSRSRGRWESFRNTVQQHVMKEEDRQGNFVQYMYKQECIFNYQSCYRLEVARKYNDIPSPNVYMNANEMRVEVKKDES